MIPEFERAKTFHALDRATIVMGYVSITWCLINLEEGKVYIPHHHHHQHQQYWHGKPLWALAFLRIARHSSLFNAALLQFLTPKILMSCHTHSSRLNLGLPLS
jgi:hypothetical protein